MTAFKYLTKLPKPGGGFKYTYKAESFVGPRRRGSAKTTYVWRHRAGDARAAWAPTTTSRTLMVGDSGIGARKIRYAESFRGDRAPTSERTYRNITTSSYNRLLRLSKKVGLS